MHPLINISGLEYSVSGFNLGPLTCSFQEGSFYIIVGNNGAGKTTLFSLMAGLLKPISGKIEITGLSDPWLYRKNLSLCLDTSWYSPGISGKANLKSTALRRNLDNLAVDDLVAGFRFEKGMNSKPKSYSFWHE